MGISSLADALSNLVDSRRNSNFQVIVITHDVDLLDALSRGTQIEHYHKVSRDENGESIVNKTAVSTRMEKILSNRPGCLYFLQNSELTKFLFRDENGKSIVNKNAVKADEENLVKST